jgi:hypothetical protein
MGELLSAVVVVEQLVAAVPGPSLRPLTTAAVVVKQLHSASPGQR